MVLKKNYRSRRGNSTTKLAITLAVLIVIILVGRVLYVKAQLSPSDSNGQNTKTKQVVINLNSDQSSWSKLRDQDNTFEIKYPKELFKKVYQPLTSPLANQEKLKAVGLAHLISIKSCSLADLSPNCTATTSDIAIDFFTVPRSFNDIFKDLQKSYGQNMPVITIDGHQGVRFSTGLPGQGEIYTVLPISNAKTLFVKRSYLNEDFDRAYKTTPGFINYTAQKALFDQIMSTLTFRPTI